MPAEGSQNGRTIAARPKPLPPGAREAAFSMGASSRTSVEQAFSITLNGELHQVEGDTGLSALIARLGMRPSRIAVELNREVVPKSKYDTITLKAGDELEIINFVGGG
jgi:sulfur carrier protein